MAVAIIGQMLLPGCCPAEPIHILVRDKRPNQGCLADRDPNIFIGGRGVCSIRVLREKVRVSQWLNWKTKFGLASGAINWFVDCHYAILRHIIGLALRVLNSLRRKGLSSDTGAAEGGKNVF